jgi:feruloyl-CoA synthase
MSETALSSPATARAAPNAGLPALAPLAFGDLSVDVEAGAGGVLYVRPRQPLGPYPERLSDKLLHWAQVAPERQFLCERSGEGWRRLSYRATLEAVAHLASALLARDLSAERPVLILSGNGVDHALLGLACLHAGIPYCPVSPAYALVSRDFGKLRHAIELLTPGLVFVDDATPFAAALAATVPADVEIVACRGRHEGRAVTAFQVLIETPVSPEAMSANRFVTPDTIAKFLLTSGSTGMPKAVINTQRMLCANQAMLRQTLAFLGEEPPVLVDWLPWNHTFGGNHNLGIVLYNGGTLYIDGGKPAPGAIAETLRNLGEIAPTVYFNVPKGWEMLVTELRADAALRRRFFSRLRCMFFSGAMLSAHIWRALDELGIAETGRRVPMLTSLGATETAPFSLCVTPETSRSGHVGLPVPGNAIKLLPNAGKLEVRVKGPNVTPGYWRQPELTRAAFDEEGFYRYGDALKPVDPGDLSKGFDFDGRISEDFKLASGTWVSVGPLRTATIAACAPFVREVVLAGHDCGSLAALILLDTDGCAAALPHLAGRDLGTIARDDALRQALAARLTALAEAGTGSATRICRVAILDTPPSIDKSEVTDKGSINQRAVLQHRADIVAALYAEPPPAFVLTITEA